MVEESENFKLRSCGTTPIVEMAESISLEETNKIRISLGLKPLTDDSKSSDTKEQTAEDNFAKRREQEARERERKYVVLRIYRLCHSHGRTRLGE